MEQLALEYLADHPNLVPLVAEWHWRNGNEELLLEFWIRAHEGEAQGRDVPTAWVALLSGRPVGSVSLIRCNMATHPEWTPWLAALFVLPEFRERGVGTALTRHCEESAGLLEYPTLYLYATAAAGFYVRLGWRVRAVEEYEGEEVLVMEKSLS